MAGPGSCEGVLLLVLAPWALTPSLPSTLSPSLHPLHPLPRPAAPCCTCSGDTIGGSDAPLFSKVSPRPARTLPAAPRGHKVNPSESTDINVEPLLTLNLDYVCAKCDPRVLY